MLGDNKRVRPERAEPDEAAVARNALPLDGPKLLLRLQPGHLLRLP